MPFEPRYSTLVDLFRVAVRDHGPRELFGTKKSGRWTWTTYAEFGAMVERFRGGLASLGVDRGDCVAIVSDNRVEWAVAAYACYGLGAAFVPMYQAQHPKEWDFIVRDCEAKVLIVANETIRAKAGALFESAPSLRTLVVLDAASDSSAVGPAVERTVSYASLTNAGRSAPSVVPKPSDTAGLIYTSGTTGDPKGVILTHENIASNVSAINELMPADETDRSLSFLPWAHVFGQTAELHVLLSTGASMALCEGVDKILDNLGEVRPTLLFSVPRIFNKIYMAVQQQISAKPRAVQVLVERALRVAAKKRRGERLTLIERAVRRLVDRVVFSKVRARFGGRLKYAFSGGAALSPQVAEFIDSLGVTVYEGYGLTETSPIVTANAPTGRKIGSVGRPVPGVRVEIDRATGESKAPSEGGERRFEGEIIVHGHNVMKGYLKRPAENAAVFTSDGGFRTGDMGYVDSQGYLFITGRIKEQYKLENGKYVVPTPLEEGLKLSPYVANVMVYGDNRPYNVALVVANLPAVRRWAEGANVGLPADDEEAVKDERVRALFRGEIAKYTLALKNFESVRDFALIATDFTTDNGLLTPSLKLKRRKVVEAFASTLERLYAGKTAQPAAGAVSA